MIRFNNFAALGRRLVASGLLVVVLAFFAPPVGAQQTPSSCLDRFFIAWITGALSGDFGGNRGALPPLSPNASVDEAIQWWSEISVQQWEAFYVGFEADRFFAYLDSELPSECTSECATTIPVDPIDRLVARLLCLIQIPPLPQTPALSFSESSYEVLEGNGVVVFVGLTQPLQSTVTIGLTVTNQGGATAADYSGVPESVTFTPGATTASFAVAAAADGIADSGESVVLGFGALPEGVTAGQNTSTTVTIVEPVVSGASFSASNYEVLEGQQVEVVVELGEALEFPVTIGLTVTNQGGATAADYSGVPQSVTFAQGETTTSFTVAAAADGIADSGESVVLGFGALPEGVTAGQNTSTTVTIVEPVVSGASFSASNYEVLEGQQVEVVVELGEALEFPVTIGLTVTNQGGATAADYSGVPQSVTFAQGETTTSFTVAAAADGIADSGESVVLGFGALPEGVTAGQNTSTTVTIVEAVVRDVSVSFSSRRYEVMEGQQVEVVVELSEALDDPITIMLTTANLGGATGADYSGIPESVTFAPGETRKSFTVLATDDAADESGEGVELGFGTPLPEGITVPVTDSTAMVIISSDAVSPAERIVVEETLKAVAAGAVANVTSNIGARFSGVRSGAPVLTLAGQPVALEPGLSTQAGFDQYRRSSWSNGLGLKGRSGSLSATDLLRTTVFQVSLGASEEGTKSGVWSQLTLWGRGDVLFFDSDAGGEEGYDGDLLAGYVGVDGWLNDQWLAGVAVSRTGVAAEYGVDGGGGELELTMTGVHPYVRFAPNQRSELWVILGAAFGRIENRRNEVAQTESSDVKLYMGAAGVRQALTSGGIGGVDLALLGDIGFGRLDGDPGTGLQAVDDLAVDTMRVRLGVEGSYTTALGNQKTLTPFLEIAGRFDGGSGDKETGLELAGGVAYADPVSGLGLEARGNILALYSQNGYQEYGASLTASFSPGAGGEGLSFSVTPRVGRESRGADTLWRDDPFSLANGLWHTEGEASLEARLGYGIRTATEGMLTPFGEVRLWDGDGRRMRAGVRFGGTGSMKDGLSVELFGDQSSAGGDAEHRIGLVGRWRF